MNSTTLQNDSSFSDGERLLLHGRYSNIMPFFGAVIVTLNIIGIILIIKSKSIAKNLKVYIISLMTCDSLTGLILSVGPVMYRLLSSRQVEDQSVSMIRTLLLISILHTTGLSIDRLISIKQPNFYLFRITPRTCTIVCIFIWFVSIVYHTTLVTLASFYPLSGQFDKRTYGVYLSIYILCVSLYLGSSRKIIACARKHIKRIHLCPRLNQSVQDQQSSTFRLSIVITTASGFLFALYLPVMILVILTFIDPNREMKVTKFFLEISYPLLTLESLLNPLLYLVRFRVTRQTITKFLCPSKVDFNLRKQRISTGQRCKDSINGDLNYM